MTTDHTLTAEADTVFVLQQADSAQIAIARQLLGAADPVQAFAALLTNASSLEASLGTVAAARALATANTFGFDPVRDSAALRAVGNKLGGHVFDVSLGSSASASMQSSSSGNVSSTFLPITIIYVNGIQTGYMDAFLTEVFLRDLVRTGNLPNYSPSNYRVKHYYNATMEARRGEAAYCGFVSAFTAWGMGLGPLSLLDFVQHACGLAFDLGRAAQQIADLVSSVPVGSSDADSVLALIKVEQNQGRGVIVVGHSQGTLIAQQALRSLYGIPQDLNSSAAKCSGFISLAGPNPNAVAVRNLDGFYTQGLLTKDLMLVLLPLLTVGQNGVGTDTTVLTDTDRAFWNGLLTVPIIGKDLSAGTADIALGIRLHAVDGSYLSAHPIRAAIQGALQRQINAIETDCSSTPLSIVLTPASLSFTAVGGAAVPASQTVAITSGGTGVLTGLALGTIAYSETPGWLGTPNLNAATGVLTVRPNTTNLAAGTYHSTLPFTADGGVSASLTVTYSVTAAPLLTAPALTAPANAAAGIPTTPTFSWTAVPGANMYWLMLATSPSAFPSDPTATSCPQCTMAGFTAATTHTLPNPFPNGASTGTQQAGPLNAGTTYYWQVQGFNNGVTPISESQYSATSTFTTATAVGAPSIQLDRTTVPFSFTIGGSLPSIQTVNISNGGTGTLNGLSLSAVSYTAGQPTGWLTPSLTATTAPTTVGFAIVRSDLPQGIYTATVQVSSSAPGLTGGPQTITVTLTVSAVASTPSIQLDRSTVPFSFTIGGSLPSIQTVNISNGGTGTLNGLSISAVSYTALQPTGWLTPSLTATTAPTAVGFSIVRSDLPQGTYTATVQVSSSAPGLTGGPQTITVTVTVSAAAACPSDFSFTGALPYAIGSTLVGVIDASTCLIPHTTDGRWVPYYFTLATGTLLRFDWSSTTASQTSMSLQDPDSTRIYGLHWGPGYPVYFLAGAGRTLFEFYEYAQPLPANYTLHSQPSPSLATCPNPVFTSNSVSATLSLAPACVETFESAYQYPSNLVIRVSSTAFTPVITVRNGYDHSLLGSTAGQNGPTVQLTVVIPQSALATIEISSAVAGQGGQYTLAINP